MYSRPKASVDSRISALEQQVLQLNRIVQKQSIALKNLAQQAHAEPFTAQSRISQATQKVLAANSRQQAQQVLAANNRRARNGKRRF